MSSQFEAVPTPSNRVPILGDAMHLDTNHPTRSLMDLADELGPIYGLKAPGQDVIVVTGGDIIEECLDETRFEKNVGVELIAMREVVGDAVFTSWTSEPAWKKGHNILLPAFAPQAIKGYTAKMADIAEQLILKWARLNPGEPVDVSTDMTKLTFDTISLVCFSYRPGSFYRQDMPPEVQALEEAITECVNRPSRLPGQDVYEALKGRREYKENVSYLNQLADKIITDRVEGGKIGEFGDVLDIMLTEADRASGEKLDRLNIRQQLLTFLAAGYDTTSGMLMWTVYYLLKNPDALARCYEEVDEVFGTDLSVLPDETQIPKLQYVMQCMKEALRLWPVGPGFQVRPLEDEVLAGKYQLKKGQPVLILTPQVQRNPELFPDPESFDPDRFSPELEAQRPAWSWMPFGSGERACIGRHFSFYESQLLLGLILQRFKLIDEPEYELDIKDFFSIKPIDLQMRIEPRPGQEQAVMSGIGRAGTTPEDDSATTTEPKKAQPTSDVGAGNTITVLYGSNLGTSERVANEIAQDAQTNGFTVVQGELDSYVDKLPTEGVVVICTSSYNGHPPDNAVEFHKWLGSGLAPDSLAGVKFTVFGSGDKVWASTFQKVPAEIDELLVAAGAQRVYERGVADASDDFDGMFRQWYRDLWSNVGDTLGIAMQPDVANEIDRYEVEVTESRLHGSFFSSLDATGFRIVTNRELLGRVEQHSPLVRSTRHIEFAVPPGVTYQTGDHIALIPRNATQVLSRAAAIAELELDQLVVLRANSNGGSHLPLDVPFVVSELFATRLELQEPMTRAQIRTLAAFADDDREQVALTELGSDEPAQIEQYRSQILAKRINLFDMLERFPSIDLPLNIGLDLLPALRPRYYSISSSPSADPEVLSITVGALRAPARSGEGNYFGTSSNFLNEAAVGTVVHGFVRPPGLPFNVPTDPSTPIIMIATGTGLSPFRGFLQERAAQAKVGEVGKALLIYGCRAPDSDFIYEDEVRAYEKAGVVEVVTAYSDLPDGKGAWVQNKVTENADQILDLLDQGAVVYVCGGADTVAPALRQAFADIYSAAHGADDEQAQAWIESLRSSQHYLEDVWAGH